MAENTHSLLDSPSGFALHLPLMRSKHILCRKLTRKYTNWTSAAFAHHFWIASKAGFICVVKDLVISEEYSVYLGRTECLIQRYFQEQVCEVYTHFWSNVGYAGLVMFAGWVTAEYQRPCCTANSAMAAELEDAQNSASKMSSKTTWSKLVLT